MHVYVICTRITRTYQACSRFCLFHTNPGGVDPGSRKTSLKKIEYREMKKCATTISEGTIAKGFIEARPDVHHNMTRAHTSLCAVQTNVLLRQQASGRSSTNLYFHYKLP